MKEYHIIDRPINDFIPGKWYVYVGSYSGADIDEWYPWTLVYDKKPRLVISSIKERYRATVAFKNIPNNEGMGWLYTFDLFREVKFYSPYAYDLFMG